MIDPAPLLSSKSGAGLTRHTFGRKLRGKDKEHSQTTTPEKGWDVFMHQREIHNLWQDLYKAGVIRDKQHIILSSGLHTEKYGNFVTAKIPFGYREQLLRWVKYIIENVFTEQTVFLGTGCGRWYAEQTAFRFRCDSVYAERNLRGDFVFNRDQGLILAGRPVIIVDDVLTEGTTLAKLITLASSYGGTPVACTVFLNRSGKPFKNAAVKYVPVHAMYEENFPTWTEADCPMCKDGVPFSTQHGKGAEVFHLKGQPQPQKS
ncbi:MAG: phosphoribosyltransferase family protein [bacterium]|nr:phosphoribosyltransferase family protein [bacterium]